MIYDPDQLFRKQKLTWGGLASFEVHGFVFLQLSPSIKQFFFPLPTFLLLLGSLITPFLSPSNPPVQIFIISQVEISPDQRFKFLTVTYWGLSKPLAFLESCLTFETCIYIWRSEVANLYPFPSWLFLAFYFTLDTGISRQKCSHCSTVSGSVGDRQLLASSLSPVDLGRKFKYKTWKTCLATQHSYLGPLYFLYTQTPSPSTAGLQGESVLLRLFLQAPAEKAISLGVWWGERKTETRIVWGLKPSKFYCIRYKAN